MTTGGWARPSLCCIPQRVIPGSTGRSSITSGQSVPVTTPEYNNFLMQPFLNYNLKGGIPAAVGPLLLGKPEADIITDSFLHLGYRDRPPDHRAIPVLAYEIHDVRLRV